MRVSVLVSRPGNMGPVAGGLDSTEERLDRDALVLADGRLFGREVDARLDAVKPVQGALDLCCAGGAVHPLELEPHLVRALCLGHRGPSDDTPPGYLVTATGITHV